MFDWNIHLPCGSDGLDDRWCDEGKMNGQQLIHCLNSYQHQLSSFCDAGNFMVFNASLGYGDVHAFASKVEELFPSSTITMLANFGLEQKDIAAHVKTLRDCGIYAVKFHCYFQKIGEDWFETALLYASEAQKLGMPILIDTSYGSTEMYTYDNLKLAARVLKFVTECPVILLHSGGARAIEAFLLADACPNVYLETSFSIPYYLDSSIEKDLAFAYKKIGASRVLYGSDFPYVDLKQSLDATHTFMQRNNFPLADIAEILSHNPESLLVQL